MLSQTLRTLLGTFFAVSALQGQPSLNVTPTWEFDTRG